MRTSQNTKRNITKTKKEKEFNRFMQERLAIAVLVIMLALFALVLVLYNIVKNKKDEYNQIVLSQQSYDSRVIPYRRGDILDRNGSKLATSEQVFNLILDPKQILLDSENYLEITLTALSDCFGYEREELRRLIQEKSDTSYIRYARRLSREEKDRFLAYEAEIKEKSKAEKSSVKVAGVWFEDEYQRKYPNNSIACNVVGFSNSDGADGNGGIEQYHNNSLIGVNGREYGYLNDESNLERVIKPAVNGNTVVSTIDINIQKIVERYIEEWENETGSDNIGIIAMNPNNAEILAMASGRKFDLNNPKDLTPFYSSGEIASMDDKEKMEACYQIWRNYCISDAFEPGSPFKIFTVAAAMEEGAIIGNESFLCDGFQEIGGWKIRCVKRTGHGMLTVPESLMLSCNEAMMQIAAKTGRTKFAEYQRIFGFGSKTGIDLPGEADTKSLLYAPDKMGSTELATNSFGQTFNCTMIQMAAAYASVINGGSYYEPRVVKQILNERGSVVKKTDPILVRETVSAATSAYIKDVLFRTVEEGTGSAAAVGGYKVGGKTGTAEKLPRGTGDYLVSFCGFAPVDNPQVLVYVTIDVPHVPDQPHSSFASAVFSKIMGDILPYMSVFPVEDDETLISGNDTGLPEQEGIINQTGETESSGAAGAQEEAGEAEESQAERPSFEQEEYVEPIGEGESVSPLPNGLTMETENVP